MDEALQQAVAVSLPAAAECLIDELVPQVDSPAALREKHLVRALEAGVVRSTRLRCITGRVIPIPGWPSLGRSGVDLAIDSGADRYPALVEAKWCHLGKDKLYEAIWDVFKMALGLRRADTRETFLVTGAPVSIWRNGFCADLLEGGQFASDELCTRLLPWGRHPRWLAWDDLLYGGHDRFPDEVPATIATEPVSDPVPLALEKPCLCAPSASR